MRAWRHRSILWAVAVLVLGYSATSGGEQGEQKAAPDAAGEYPGSCVPGSKQCSGQVPQTCSASGQWVDGAACANACLGGTCSGECDPANKDCQGLIPSTFCTKGAKRCNGKVPQTCDARGEWQSASACPYVCSAGACTGVCVPGSKQCSGFLPQTCQGSGEWGAGKACSGNTPICSAGQCVVAMPPSCIGLAATCGASGTDSCCASSVVTGGTYNRSNNASYPATVSDFRMDKYEVTVGRFRKFVAAWVGGWRPAAGAGKHTHLNRGSGLAATGGGYEAGWDTAWSSNLATTASGWDTNLMQSAPFQTWTSSPGTQENRPINDVTWFEAYAFCIWDGGFLPSEAEWNYAAAGGSEQRQYPWSNPPTSPIIDCSYAKFNHGQHCSATHPNNVGANSPKGDGKWGQSDLAGNVLEWTLDWNDYAYRNPCTNCVNLTAAHGRVVRGGSWNDVCSSHLSAAFRNYGTPSVHNVNHGVRCARGQ